MRIFVVLCLAAIITPAISAQKVTAPSIIATSNSSNDTVAWQELILEASQWQTAPTTPPESIVKELPKFQEIPKGAANIQIPKGTDPTIGFSGASSRALGRMAIIKVKYTGDDLKFDCSPKNDYWMLVKFFDDSVGIIFDAEKPGIYTFVAAVNGNGKTAISTFPITITGDPPAPPTPPIPPAPTDPFVLKMQNAYTTDIAAGVGKPEQRIALAKAYQQGVTDFISVAKTNADLASMQKKLNEQLIGTGTMPQVRAVIASEVLATLGKEATTALDKAKATNLWNKFADALNKIQ